MSEFWGASRRRRVGLVAGLAVNFLAILSLIVLQFTSLSGPPGYIFAAFSVLTEMILVTTAWIILAGRGLAKLWFFAWLVIAVYAPLQFVLNNLLAPTGLPLFRQPGDLGFVLLVTVLAVVEALFLYLASFNSPIKKEMSHS